MSAPPRLLERLAHPSPAASVPARTVASGGEPRRVGVEVEFAGLELMEAAELVAERLDGEVVRETDYEVEVRTPALGELTLEVDNRLLKELGREREEDGEPGLAKAAAESLLASAVGGLTPLELVTPPLAIDDLPRLDELFAALGEAGAHGTQESLLAAFGVHYNPEVADDGGPALRDHLRAFLVLYPWLLEELEVDVSRRVTPFIDPFPRDYVVELLAPDAPSERSELIDHYLAANPTRNRALDMLPLFAHLEPERVRAVVDDPRLKPRPTFHYRLTNSGVGTPGWTVSAGWRHWLVVEDLAADARLGELAADYRAFLERPLGRLGGDWPARVRARLA